MPPDFSENQLPPCDFRFHDQCIEAIAKACVANRTANVRDASGRRSLWSDIDEQGDEQGGVISYLYLDGWDGLGASSLLRGIVKSLASMEEMWCVDWTKDDPPILIHVDCSTWESIRAVQREVAKQLNLSSSVMKKFDQQDEEDDYDGVDQGSRDAVEDVATAISERVEYSGFWLVLHNGGNSAIDVDHLGLSVNSNLCTVFWTFRGRFRVDPKLIDKVIWEQPHQRFLDSYNEYRSYYYYYYGYQPDDEDDGESSVLLLRAEAEEVARKHGVDPDLVFNCITYMLDRNHMSLHNIDHDWALHACNYWICDGIIPQEAHETWQLGEALHRDMGFFIEYLSSPELSRQGCTQVDGRDLPLHHMRMSGEHKPYFISAETCGFILNPTGIVPDNKFQHTDKLHVLKLSRCTFRFASPPFLCCHSLRFLCLDHCRDLVSSTGAEEEENTTRSWPCFQNLWVLDLRYTHWDEILCADMLDLMSELRELNVTGAQNWDMSHLRGRLTNIHKLKVTKSTCSCNSEETVGRNLFLEMERMEVFEFSENHTTQGMTNLSGAARSSRLKTVTVGKCAGLENISFRGCQELKDLFFTGLFASLEELDLSNTAIKILDLQKLEAAHLKRLILLGCKKLRAILWPPKDKRAQHLEVLRIDNTQSSSSDQANLEEEIKEDRPSIVSPSSAGGKELVGSGQAASFYFNWYISISDARFLRSIVCVKHYLKGKCVCIEMSSYPPSNVVSGGIRNQPIHYSSYAYESWSEMRACPPAPTLTAHDCYFHVQDEDKMQPSTERCAASPPALICNITNVLHVHDSHSITGFPSPPDSEWNCLVWCQVEKCPKLQFVFDLYQKKEKKFFWETRYGMDIFCRLRTFRASQLPEVLYIWTWGSPYSNRPGDKSFDKLEFLHLDSCPKLEEVFRCSLITKFPNLRHMHLNELPMMKQIFGRVIFAPVLETINIRGCESLRRLPVITGNTRPPKVDCKHAWWLDLEWDGMRANHHPSLYEPSHSSD